MIVCPFLLSHQIKPTNYILMLTIQEMFTEIIEKRLKRKREMLRDADLAMQMGIVSPKEKRNYIEVKAVILELENVLDLAETMLK